MARSACRILFHAWQMFYNFSRLLLLFQIALLERKSCNPALDSRSGQAIINKFICFLLVAYKWWECWCQNFVFGNCAHFPSCTVSHRWAGWDVVYTSHIFLLRKKLRKNTPIIPSSNLGPEKSQHFLLLEDFDKCPRLLYKREIPTIFAWEIRERIFHIRM